MAPPLFERMNAGVSIRAYRADDAPALHEASLESVREVEPFLPWCHPGLTLEDARRWIDTHMAAREARSAFEFAIVSGEDALARGARRATLHVFRSCARIVSI